MATKRARVAMMTCIALLAGIASGCDGQGGGGSGGGAPPATARCNGQPATAATRLWSLPIVHKQTQCVVDIGTARADSAAEAQACLRAVHGASLEAQTSGTAGWYFFAIYLPQAAGYYCSTAQVAAMSPAGGQACSRGRYCANCTHVDITGQVFRQGTIDQSALANYCAAHPAP